MKSSDFGLGELIENVIKKSKKDFIVNPGKRLIAMRERLLPKYLS